MNSNHDPSGCRPLIGREPGGAEDGEGALDHDGGPAIEGTTEEAGDLEDVSGHGDTADTGSKSQDTSPGPDHGVPQPEHLQDGVGEGDGDHAHDQHHVVGPGNRGIAPTEGQLGTLGNRTPCVEYTGLVMILEDVTQAR